MARADPTTRFAPVPEPTPSSPDRRQALIALGYGAASLTALWRWATASGESDATPADTADGSSAGPRTVPAIDQAPAEPTDEHLYDLVIADGRVMDPDSRLRPRRERRHRRRHDRGRQAGGAPRQADDRRQGQGRGTGLHRHPVLRARRPRRHVQDRRRRHHQPRHARHQLDASDFFARYTDKSMVNFGGAFDDPWHRADVYGISPAEPATEYQIGQLAAELEKQLHEGWIGVDFEPEYTPGIDFAEMKAPRRGRREYGVPCNVPRPLLRLRAPTRRPSTRSSTSARRPAPPSTSSTSSAPAGRGTWPTR